LKKYLFLLFTCLMASSAFVTTAAQADWAYRFVVHDGKSYIISDSRLETGQIDSIIGKVTLYSDEEGTYSGNFSNYYPQGTEYYSIKGTNINEAIAIKVSDGSFIKADYQGEYEGATFNWIKVLPYIVGVFVFVIVVFIVKNNWK
jgi:hypothetical protein